MAAVDYGAMWDAHHSKPQKLAKEAGIPASWMRVEGHKPKNRDDFMDKMSKRYYDQIDAAGADDSNLPNCVGLALTVQIRSGLHSKFAKDVTLEAVLAAIYSACPEMLEGGIQPSEAIRICNQSHRGRGLLIPGTTSDTVYWVQLKPKHFTHNQFAQAFTAVQRMEKLGCPAMAVMVVPEIEPPLHAMVARGAGFLPGNEAAMRAFDTQCSQGQNEAKITIDDFHALVVCDIDASEKHGREPPKNLSANAGFQRHFDSALRDAQSVRKVRQPSSMFCSIGCIRAQRDEPDNHVLFESLENVQKAFADQQERFHKFLEVCELEVAQACEAFVRLSSDPDQRAAAALSMFSSISSQACAHAVNLRSDVAGMAAKAKAITFTADAARRVLEQKMEGILSQFDFDEDSLMVIREGIEDIMKYLVRKQSRR